MNEQKISQYSLVIAIVAIGLASLSLVVDWQEYLFTQQINSPPDIVVCLKSFSYEKGSIHDSGRSIVPIGEISFDLVNRGNTEATVHRVDVFPTGKNIDGERKSMWFELEVQETVSGNGIKTVQPFPFDNEREWTDNWVEELEEVSLVAFWPNGNGHHLTCQLDRVSVKEGDWACGYPQKDGGLLGENACR